MTLNSGVDYLMTGRVTVGNGNGQLETNGDGTLDDGSAVQAATLTIEAGVEVFGETGTFANLLITRGSKIMAMGTADAPIVFSSDDTGYDGAVSIELEYSPEPDRIVDWVGEAQAATAAIMAELGCRPVDGG